MNDTERTGEYAIVTFNVLPIAYGLVTRWAEENGHTIALVVTTPGPSTRRTPTYSGVVAMAPPGVDVLVTTRLRRVALPLIRDAPRLDRLVHLPLSHPARTHGNPALTGRSTCTRRCCRRIAGRMSPDRSTRERRRLARRSIGRRRNTTTVASSASTLPLPEEATPEAASVRSGERS